METNEWITTHDNGTAVKYLQKHSRAHQLGLHNGGIANQRTFSVSMETVGGESERSLCGSISCSLKVLSSARCARDAKD